MLVFKNLKIVPTLMLLEPVLLVKQVSLLTLKQNVYQQAQTLAHLVKSHLMEYVFQFK
jgi:hypothetical protein